MIRRLFTISTAFSLLLCIATVVMWVRSYNQSDEMVWRVVSQSPTAAGTLVKFCNASGGMDLEVHRFKTDIPLNPRPDVFELHEVPAGMSWFHRPLWISRAGFFDFFWFSDRGVRQDPHLIEDKFFVATPHWFLFLLTLLLPVALMARLLIRRLALVPGHCPTCRYNLTGNTSGICPECGACVGPSTTSQFGR